MSDKDELLDLLHRERVFLLGGELDRLDRIVPLKSTLAERIVAAGSKHDLAEVLPQLRRNETLLDASRDGLVAARERIQHLRRRIDRLSVYKADGLRTDISLANPSLKKTV